MRCKKILYIAIIGFIFSCEHVKESDDMVVVQGPFFGLEPTKSPQLLVPELLASAAQEYNGTFSPDGTEFYYTTDIPENAFITYTVLGPDNIWSEPKIAPFSGVYSDYDPLFSPDGSRIYFSSSRPLPDNQNSKIWYVERTDSGWGEPVSLVFTGGENNEYYSSVTNKGDIYFNALGDIYKARKEDTTFIVEKLPKAINTNSTSVDPFISPDEEYIIYRDYRAKDSYGRSDLYISFNINGEWTVAENLGEPINSAGNEMCPYVTTDGKFFIFSSSRVIKKFDPSPLAPIKSIQDKYKSYNNGVENIYFMSTDFIDEMRRKHTHTEKN